MIALSGSAKGEQKTIRDLTKLVPTRLLRFMLRVASLQKGRYVIIVGVGDNDIEWSVSSIGKTER